MPRYVILEHDWPTLHWDLFVEAGPVLRAWRLLAEPNSGHVVAAEANGDHRLDYLTYEGPVSGGRGTVSRWDAGTFTWIDGENGRVVMELQGGKLAGRVSLEQQEAGNWEMRCSAQPGE